jgi:hypothetical protein
MVLLMFCSVVGWFAQFYWWRKPEYPEKTNESGVKHHNFPLVYACEVMDGCCERDFENLDSTLLKDAYEESIKLFEIKILSWYGSITLLIKNIRGLKELSLHSLPSECFNICFPQFSL